MTILKSRVIQILALSTLWLGILFSFQNPTLVLRRDLHDLASNISTGFLFFENGLEIYSKPTGDYFKEDHSPETMEIAKRYNFKDNELFRLVGRDKLLEPIFVVWSFVPRPYPPLSYSFFGPASILYRDGHLSLISSSAILLFFFLIFAHASIFLLIDFFRESVPKATTSKWIYRAGLLLLAFVIIDILRVSLMGSYDIVALYFLLKSLLEFNKRRWSLSVLFFSIALALHIRTLYYAPILIFALAHVIHKNFRSPFKIITDKLLWTALVFGSIFGIFLLKIKSSLGADYPHTNRLYFGNWDATLFPHFAVFFLALMSIIAFLAWRKNWLLLVSTSWLFLMLSASPYLKSWYSLFLVPLFLISLIERKGNSNIIVCLFVITLFGESYLTNSPFEFQFLRDLVAAFNGLIP